jgi:hypothetical protein
MYRNLPSKWRQGLKRNGKPTVELDYSGLHINMLYHSKGLQTPDVDPYDVLDLDRPDAKQIMNTLLNAASYPSYYASIKGEKSRGKLDFKGHTAKEIGLSSRVRRHPSFILSRPPGKPGDPP